MKIIKRNAIIIAVVLFVGVAVYLNWAYNRQETELEEQGQEASGVMDTVGSEDLFYTAPVTAPVLSATDAVTEYFTSARLTRQQARDSAISTLREAAEEQTEAASGHALDAITEMAKFTVSEAEIESLVMAKGFDDCLVFLDDDSVIVAVSAPASGLSASAVSRITDIVLQETPLSTEQIKIIEVK